MFSPGGGVQWENTGAAFLAFEWFLREIHDGPSETSQIDCNGNAEVCAIARSRDDLKASMLSFVLRRSQLLQATGDQKYLAVAGSLSETGTPSGFG